MIAMRVYAPDAAFPTSKNPEISDRVRMLCDELGIHPRIKSACAFRLAIVGVLSRAGSQRLEGFCRCLLRSVWRFEVTALKAGVVQSEANVQRLIVIYDTVDRGCSAGTRAVASNTAAATRCLFVQCGVELRASISL